MTKCTVCKKNKTTQYKCPKCYILYCSVACYKNHQNKGCKIKVKSEEIPANNAEYKYVTEDTIAVEKLKLLNDSEELKGILRNPHVREMLIEIDQSSNPTEIMEKAMREPIFVEFADTCLKIVEEDKVLSPVI